MLRDGDSWLRLVAGNPFLAAGADSDMLHAACLSAAPSAERVARLEPDRSPPDAFVVVGADVYLSLPNGVARSKLTNAWLDARLGVVSTMRNWRTVTKLAAMVEAAALSRAHAERVQAASLSTISSPVSSRGCGANSVRASSAQAASLTTRASSSAFSASLGSAMTRPSLSRKNV